MIRILFWNINKKPLAQLVRLLANDHAPDVIILAECPEPVAQLVAAFNDRQSVVYRFYATNTHGLVALARLPVLLKEIVLTSSQLPELNGRVAFYQVTPLLGPELLIVGLHLSSKLRLDNQDQSHLAIRIRPVLEDVEQQVNHQRTVVIGDFNMDPFETGLVGADGFHAIMDRKLIAGKGGQRTTHSAVRHFFYNPMWSLLGDESVGPPGTYFYEGGLNSYYWHTFDQVLIRPALLSNFQPGNIHVLTSAGSTALLNLKGIPDKKNASDHLPLLVIL